MTMTETGQAQTESYVIDIPADLSTLTVAQLRTIHDAIRDDDVVPAVPKSAPKAALVEAIEDYRTRVQTAIAGRLGVEPSEEIEAAAVAEIGEVDVAPARNLPAAEAMVARGEVSPDDVAAQRDKITQVMEAVMRADVHYGRIPGVNKPTLLKPGAEVLAVTFRLAPSYRSERTFDGPHLTVVSSATLTHIPTGLVVAEGEGLCSTRESKYAYRGEGRTCPACGASAIKKSKFAPRQGDYEGASTSDPPGWYCYAKVGGCGANFAASDPAIVGQDTGRVDNPDLPDTWNTVLKMANKRALVAAVLNGTAASDIFTQDVEDAGVAAADRHETEPHDLDEQTTRESIDRKGERPFGDDQQTGKWVGPKDWTELSKRIVAQLGDDAEAWMEELAEKAYRMPSLSAVVRAQESEVSADRKRDLWQRLNVVLRGLEETDRPVDGVGFALMPGVRAIVQRIVAEAFDRTLALDGPAWALDPEEAATRPNRDGTPPAAVGADLPTEAESVADPSQEPQATASGAEDASSAASGDDIDQIPF